jgi:hypothetical protein
VTWRIVDRSEEEKPRLEIRAIRWLVRRLRESGDFKLRLGHSLALQSAEPELYMEIVYGDDETAIFDMTFTPEIWPKIRNTMGELEWKLEKEYEEVKRDE